MLMRAMVNVHAETMETHLFGAVEC